MSPLGAEAYAYGWLLNWRILPCQPGGKLAILRDWPAKATADRDTIARWWGARACANVAVATGPGSGIFVLDVDGPEGERALAELERQHGDLPERYCQQFTGSGHGWQAFFRWPAGRTIRNSAGKLGAGLDVRGDGGYVVLPPSIHPSGLRYRWAIDRDPYQAPPNDAPGWLIELIDPPAAPRAEWCRSDPCHQVSDHPASDRYIRRALEAELEAVAAAPNGQRNDQLNASAHALFRFAGDLPVEAIEHALLDAARHAGLTDREAVRTIRSAAKARGVGHDV